jgi:hypothetical protein
MNENQALYFMAILINSFSDEAEITIGTRYGKEFSGVIKYINPVLENGIVTLQTVKKFETVSFCLGDISYIIKTFKSSIDKGIGFHKAPSLEEIFRAHYSEKEVPQKLATFKEIISDTNKIVP